MASPITLQPTSGWRSRAPGRGETFGKILSAVLSLSLKPLAPHIPHRCFVHSQTPRGALCHQTAGAKMRWIQQGKRGRSLVRLSSVPPWIQPKEGVSRAGSRAIPSLLPSLFPSPSPPVWGKGWLDKTSPFCSTKLVSQQRWAYNYYFLKDEPSSFRQKSPLLSELEFDVLTTVFVPRLLEERARQEGEREI